MRIQHLFQPVIFHRYALRNMGLTCVETTIRLILQGENDILAL